jgi:excinuclease ABC subunit A
VTGVSGSGKSTLINETLYPILSSKLHRSELQPMPYKTIVGLEYLDKVIAIDQDPIGRTPRSNPATYTGVFTDIRDLFASLPERRYAATRPDASRSTCPAAAAMSVLARG